MAARTSVTHGASHTSAILDMQRRKGGEGSILELYISRLRIDGKLSTDPAVRASAYEHAHAYWSEVCPASASSTPVDFSPLLTSPAKSAGHSFEGQQMAVDSKSILQSMPNQVRKVSSAARAQAGLSEQHHAAGLDTATDSFQRITGQVPDSYSLLQACLLDKFPCNIEAMMLVYKRMMPNT